MFSNGSSNTESARTRPKQGASCIAPARLVRPSAPVWRDADAVTRDDADGRGGYVDAVACDDPDGREGDVDAVARDNPDGKGGDDAADGHLYVNGCSLHSPVVQPLRAVSSLRQRQGRLPEWIAWNCLLSIVPGVARPIARHVAVSASRTDATTPGTYRHRRTDFRPRNRGLPWPKSRMPDGKPLQYRALAAFEPAPRKPISGRRLGGD